MIKILVQPTSDSEQPGAGLALPEFQEFWAEVQKLGPPEDVRITVHGKDIRATYVTGPVNHRGIGHTEKTT